MCSNKSKLNSLNDNFFSKPPKKSRIFEYFNKNNSESTSNVSRIKRSSEENILLVQSNSDDNEVCYKNQTAESIEINPELEWKIINNEKLNLKYCRLFLPNSAFKYFSRLENEIEYFSGDLLKVKIFGKLHTIPRKQISFGDEGLSYTFSGTCIPAKPWPPLILELKSFVEEAINFKFNFVLVNRYKDGNDYMGEHRDDEKDLDPTAPIASLSFGQPRDFIFRHKDSRGTNPKQSIEPYKMELEHGSLLVMYPPTNNFWYHSLPKRKKALDARVNLTFRKMIRK